MNETLENDLNTLSTSPGVYLMKDEKGTVVYVGKARNLKKRVSSYFQRAGRHDPKTEAMVGSVESLETILTGSEKEALVLESNLIKRYKPRYNVILKDGKRYPSLRLDMKTDYPRLEVVRKVKKDGAVYFGPFTSSGAVKETLKVIHRTFRLRKCKQKALPKRERPCLNFQLGQCLGPCARDVQLEEYRDMAQDVILFLKGRTPELMRELQQKMLLASEREEYERAAEIRDRMFALKKTLERQVAVTTDFEDRDVIAMARGFTGFAVTVLHVRGGFLVGTRNFLFDETLSDEGAALAAFIRQYYDRDVFLPTEICASRSFEDADLLGDWLSELRGRKVKILFPRRGEKARLLSIAEKNAADFLEKSLSGEKEREAKLRRLQKRLKMERVPERIECYDISHTRGEETVASMIVFEGGEAAKGEYRRFKLRPQGEGDDYAAMREVLFRRFGPERRQRPLPDLVLVDGGRGQVSAAQGVLKALGATGDFALAGIAKKRGRDEPHDRIYLPGRANPVIFGRDSDLVLFLESVRDEAHRFAITFHRKRRGKKAHVSALDRVPGVGEKRKKALLKKFRTISGIRDASLEDLAAVPGMTLETAKNIKKIL